MKFKNSAFSASEGQIVAISTVIISIITILSYYIPAFAEFMQTIFIFSGTVLFGVPYVLFILYVLKEALRDLGQALNSELNIDFTEIWSDLKEIFLGDRNKTISFGKKKQNDDDDHIDPKIFEDFENDNK